MNAPNLTPWRKGATHCNPRERTFRTSIFEGEDIIAETVTSFEGSRFLTKRTADEARLHSIKTAQRMAATSDLLNALAKLSFECSAGRGVKPPTRETRDHCDALIQKLADFSP